MLKKIAPALASMLALTLALALIPCRVSATGVEVTASAFASSGYNGDEKTTFAPAESSAVMPFTIAEESWNFSGLSASYTSESEESGAHERNGIVFVSTGIDGETAYESGLDYTGLNIDLSSFRCDMKNYSTLYFGIAIDGENERQYSVTATLYSGNMRVTGEALVGEGWNLFCLDVSAASGMAGHIKITVNYDGEIPSSVSVASPYVKKTLDSGFNTAETFLVPHLIAAEGECTRRSGKVRPDGKTDRAVVEGYFIGDPGRNWYEVDSTEYFEIKLDGVKAGNFTLGIKLANTAETVISKKLSLGGDGESSFVVVPMNLTGRLYSFTLTFDNIECDGEFVIDYIKLHEMEKNPAEAVSGIGSLSKITRSSGAVVFSGSMERAAISEYSSSGDGLIHFYALNSADMDDISKAVELGSIKLTTVFEYTVKLSGFPSVGDEHMFFAATADRDGNIYPLSKPRFADADLSADAVSSSASSGVSLGLFNPATVGAFESNVSSVIIDVPLDELLDVGNTEVKNASSKTVSLTYTVYGTEPQNRTLEFDREKLAELDNDIAFYTSAGIKVYLRLNARSSVDNLTYSSISGCDSYAFRADSEETRAAFAAVVRFFAKRYPGIRGFELGQAVNVYSCIGEKPESAVEYVSDLAELCRICYNAASTELYRTSVILPLADTTGMEEGEYIPIEMLTVMLTSRLSEIGQIPLVFMYSFDEEESDTSRAASAAGLTYELECGYFSGVAYFYKPSLDYLEKKYSEYTSGELLEGAAQSDIMPFTEFAAQSFSDLAKSLKDAHTLGVVFSMEDTNLKNSHDFYSVLKNRSDVSGNVSDTAAVRIDETEETAEVNGADKAVSGLYVLCDFSDKYHTDGWIAGGGVESCLTDWSGASERRGGERVLSVQFKQDDYYGKSSGTAGIALYNFADSVDMTKVDSVLFTLALDGASEEAESAERAGNTVVFVIGTDDTRAEYYAEELECGRSYTFSCPLGEYENRGRVDYIGIMVYSDIELRLELSSVELSSDELGVEGIGKLLGKAEDEERINYRTIALFSFTVAAFSIMVFIFLSKLEREEAENEVRKSRTGGYTTNGGANEQKYRRQ